MTEPQPETAAVDHVAATGEPDVGHADVPHDEPAAETAPAEPAPPADEPIEAPEHAEATEAEAAHADAPDGPEHGAPEHYAADDHGERDVADASFHGGGTHEGAPDEAFHDASHSAPHDPAEAEYPHGDDPGREGHPDPTRAGYDAVEQALGMALFSDEPFDEHGFAPHEDTGVGRSGYIPMQAKPGALQYQPAISVRFGRLPNKVDLRPLMPPVEDQGSAASGVAHAVAGAYAYWLQRATRQSRGISPLFVYYNARWRDGTEAHDGGSAIQLCMEALSRFGASSDLVWPADMRLLAQRPGADAYQDAAPSRIQDLAQVPLRLQSWKQALAEGKPIVFGTVLFEPSDACSHSGGVVTMPAPADVPEAPHDLHAMCAVGYCDSEKVFIVRNSRGPHWGDGGYCYMPYSYVLNPRLNDGDCWVFVPKTSAQPPREAWSDDTKPVTNGGSGVDAPVETHSIEDYANVAVDLFEPERRPFNADLGEDYARYVALAAKGAWHEMDGFDREAFLADT